MQKKIEELYQDYLYDKLNLIFEIENEERNCVSLKCDEFNRWILSTKKGDTIKVPKGFIYEKSNGISRIFSRYKYNFINEDGVLISDTWYVKAYSFKNGFAVVKQNFNESLKLNFINTKGELISEIGFDGVSDFTKDGIANVKKENTYNFINSKGELISDTWFDYIWDFEDGVAKVKRNGVYNFINTKGNILSEFWFNEIGQFKDGFAWVKLNGVHNFINTKGELISDTWFDLIFRINDGFSLVYIHQNHKYNFINANGEYISEKWYDYADSFKNGLAVVKLNGKYNLINTNGEYISEKWYDYVDSFKNGLALIKLNGKYNLINTKGELISNIWYNEVESLQKKFAVSKEFNKSNINDDSSKLDENKISKHFIVLDDGKVQCISIEMKDYKVKKTLFGYVCSNSVDSYKIKYKPIKKYGLKYTLCLNNDKVFLHDRIEKRYIFEWSVNDFEYNDNFLFDNKNNLVYLIYENQVIEISKYYNEFLKDHKILKINSGITDFFTREQFKFYNRKQIEELLEKLREESRKINELKKKTETNKQLQRFKTKSDNLEQEKRNTKLEALKKIEEALRTLRNLSNSDDKIPKLQLEQDDVLILVSDHFEILPMYLEVLKFIDLRLISFDNVKVEGIDFSGTNLILNPQKVYQKNLRNCNFEKIFISQFLNFSGVDIRGCNFSGTSNEFNLTFKDAIYDEATTYNGISFVKILGEKVEKDFCNKIKKTTLN